MSHKYESRLNARSWIGAVLFIGTPILVTALFGQALTSLSLGANQFDPVRLDWFVTIALAAMQGGIVVVIVGREYHRIDSAAIE